MPRPILPALALTLLLALSARAELVWKSDAFDGKLGPGETRLTTRFEFKNTGAKNIRVTKVHSTCGCAKATPDRAVYAPGQEGVLTVEFSAQGAVGPQQRHLYVLTDEERREPHALTLRIDIAEWFTLVPRIMSWDRDAPASTLSARLVLDPAAKAELLGVTGAPTGFTARLVAETEPGVHRVEITPASTAEPARAVITVAVRLPSGHEETKTIHVRVR